LKVLLDTHALLWILAGDARLSDQARTVYEEADALYFSVANMWEIGIKLGLKRKDFVLDEAWWTQIPEALSTQGALQLSVTSEHCREVSQLPLHHRDPFDRMLIAQARVESCRILSVDEQIDAYDVGRIW
jgi:PIN domain nuclease of toxin-antitoxin system